MHMFGLVDSLPVVPHSRIDHGHKSGQYQFN